MRAIKRLAVIAVLTFGILSVGQAAMALTWYSKSEPLRAYEDGKTQGAAYGNFYNYNGTYARSSSTRKDWKPGGDGIFVDTAFSFYYVYGDQPAMYHNNGAGQTSRTTSGDWVDGYNQKALMDDAEKVRGSMKVCEDQSWSPDPCSDTVIRTFSY